VTEFFCEGDFSVDEKFIEKVSRTPALQAVAAKPENEFDQGKDGKATTMNEMVAQCYFYGFFMVKTSLQRSKCENQLLTKTSCAFSDSFGFADEKV